jgi:hypothetical protein
MAFFRAAAPGSLHSAPREPALPDLPECVRATLREIVELGAVRIRDGCIVEHQLPAEHLYVPSRWSPTVRAIEWMGLHGHLKDGEYFVCLFDGWREMSRYVPPADREFVRWEDLDVGSFRGRGSAGEPRFLHDPRQPNVYPLLCRPVLAYARHQGDTSVVLLPDPEFVATRGYAPVTQQLAAALRVGPPSSRLDHCTPLYWRGSRNVDPATYGPGAVGLRDAVVRCRSETVDVRFVWPGERVSLAEQIAASPLQLDLDGMVGAWSGRFWKLLAPGVVPVRPPTPWEQWYEHRLQAGVHYVPISGSADPCLPTTEQLEAARSWCVAHPDEADAIAEAGARLARTLLEEYASLIR